MWILSKYGFFSAVQKNGTDFITIRARVRGDLENLKTLIPEMTDIESYDLSDYKYRTTCSHADFANALSIMAVDIDYHNFKNMIHAVFGSFRSKIYGMVWRDLYSLQDK